jgi:hypothetical protein
LLIAPKRAMKKPWRTCREIAALISEREDRKLSTRETAVLHLHVLICARCTRWKQQVALMRHSMSTWKNYKD